MSSEGAKKTLDREACARTVADHGDAVMQVIRRVFGARDQEAEDCFQETFVEFVKQRGWTHPKPEALLRRIASANAVDRIRKRQSERRVREALRSQPVREAPAADTNLSLQETGGTLQLIQDTIAELPPIQAQAFVLTQLEGRSYEDAASSLKLDVNHIGVLVHRARASMKKKLSGLTGSIRLGAEK